VTPMDGQTQYHIQFILEIGEGEAHRKTSTAMVDFTIIVFEFSHAYRTFRLIPLAFS
jgi:hypothetical protein